MPRAYAAVSTVGQLLPRRAREALLRLAGAERATAGTTAEQRAAYEARVQRNTSSGS